MLMADGSRKHKADILKFIKAMTEHVPNNYVDVKYHHFIKKRFFS